MPTIMDVAREAGVGIGTVSRVLNGSPLVSVTTRQRVLDAIDHLGYQPSPIARAFGRRRTQQLELLVPRYAQSFALEILRGVEDALVDTDYTLSIRVIDTADDRAAAFEECCFRGRADGALLVWISPTRELVDRLAAEQFPVVLVNAVHPSLSSVAVDHTLAAQGAAAYCIGLGHRRIALVDRLEDPFESDSAGICQAGYRAALAAAGIASSDDYERVVELSAVGGAAAFAALDDLPEPPTAVLAGSESQALGVMNAALRRGRRVPQDVSVVGYNDSDLALGLGLTTVRVPLREMGQRATELLIAVIEDPASPRAEHYLPTELTVRRTCAPPRT